MSTRQPRSPHELSPGLLPELRPESRLFPRWMFGPTFLWALTVVAIPAVILGCVMPMTLAFQSRIRTPYELPAHHAVFVHTSEGPTECIVVEHGDVHGDPTDHFMIGRRGMVPFTGHRLPSQAAAGAALICRDWVVVTVDPDWRYTLANNQRAKEALTLFGVFGLAWVLHRVRDRFRHRRRPVTTEVTGGGSGSLPRRGTWRRAGRRRVPPR